MGTMSECLPHPDDLSQTVPVPEPDQCLYSCLNCGSTFPEEQPSCSRCFWAQPLQRRVLNSVPKIDYKAHDVSIRSSTALAIHQHELDQAYSHGIIPPSHDIFSTCQLGQLSVQVYDPAPECLTYKVQSSFFASFVRIDEETNHPQCDHIIANNSIINFLQEKQQLPAADSGKFPCHIAVAFTGIDLRIRLDGAVILTKKCRCQCPGCPTRFNVYVSAWADHLFSLDGTAEFSVRFKDNHRVCQHLVGATFGQTRGLARQVHYFSCPFSLSRCMSPLSYFCTRSVILSMSLTCSIFFLLFSFLLLLLSLYFLDVLLLLFVQMMAGPQPHLICQQALSPDNICEERLLTGNLQNVPRKDAAQQISSENNTKHRRDPDLLKSLQLICLDSENADKEADKAQQEASSGAVARRKLFGYVHDFRLSPPSLIVTSEGILVCLFCL